MLRNANGKPRSRPCSTFGLIGSPATGSSRPPRKRVRSMNRLFQLVIFSFLVGASTGPCFAQESSADQSWSETNAQESPNATINPIRTRETHTQTGRQTSDSLSIDNLGPDGRYIPYMDIEKESRQVDDTTVRRIERDYGRGPDGQRMLIQERQEETKTLPDGEQQTVRSVSNPDADGRLQMVQSQLEKSRLLSPGVHEVETTTRTPDPNGGLSPAVYTREVTRQKGNVLTFDQSTSFLDLSGRWQTQEARSGSVTQNSGLETTTEERVFQPNSGGKMITVRRTSKHAVAGPAGRHETEEKYSTDIPGIAGTGRVSLVQRDNINQSTSVGSSVTTRQVEQLTPGSPDGLHITQQEIDVRQATGNGMVDHNNTILTTDANGHVQQVWVEFGKTDRPSALTIGTRGSDDHR
jgi:hypothetical protein